MIPDKYQQAVIDDCAAGIGHMVVRARAGSGKTTTLIEACAHVPKGASVGYFVFNKKNQIEAAPKFAQRGLGADVLTLHGLGARACRAPIETDKVKRVIDGTMPNIEREYRSALRRGVGLAKGMLLGDPLDINDLIAEYDLDVVCETCARANDRGATPKDHPCIEKQFGHDVCAILEACKAQASTVDFDDMIWLPVVRRQRVRQYDVVFVDETQDLNLAQIRLAQAACRTGGRIIAVGDDRQAIYGFRGADRRALPRVIDELGARVRPLSVSYRCARAVVREARDLVPDLEPAPNAPAGTVHHDVPASAVEQRAAIGDYVISRKNAPLLKLCFALLRRGIPAAVLGRDVGAELGNLIDRSRAQRIEDLLDWVDEWADKQSRRARRADPEADVSRFDDVKAAIETLCERAKTVQGVRDELQRLFTDAGSDAHRVTLMSTHKAKGLEASRVWLLRDTYTTKDIEEANLLYVGITRAQRELFLVRGAA